VSRIIWMNPNYKHAFVIYLGYCDVIDGHRRTEVWELLIVRRESFAWRFSQFRLRQLLRKDQKPGKKFLSSLEILNTQMVEGTPNWNCNWMLNKWQNIRGQFHKEKCTGTCSLDQSISPVLTTKSYACPTFCFMPVMSN